MSHNEIACLAKLVADAECAWRYRRQSLEAGDTRFENFTIEECTREMRKCRAMRARLDYIDYHMDDDYDLGVIDDFALINKSDAYRETPLG